MVYCKIPIISLGLIFVQKVFWWASFLIFFNYLFLLGGGFIIGESFALQIGLGLASEFFFFFWGGGFFFILNIFFWGGGCPNSTVPIERARFLQLKHVTAWLETNLLKFRKTIITLQTFNVKLSNLASVCN